MISDERRGFWGKECFKAVRRDRRNWVKEILAQLTDAEEAGNFKQMGLLINVMGMCKNHSNNIYTLYLTYLLACSSVHHDQCRPYSHLV
jgi:hypothetical protein